MKHWSTDRSGWARVPRQQTAVKQVGSTTLVYLRALEVREPLTVTCCAQQVKIMDVNYQWLAICERGAHHITTAHCNADGEPVHWYTDIVDSWHFDANGFPCFDDLYLDIVALPDGRTKIIDGDELEAALKTHVITPTQFELAWLEAETVAAAMRQGSFGPVKRTEYYLLMFN